MTFDQQYYRINDARLQGKLLVSGQKWQDFVEDRKKLAPIERLVHRKLSAFLVERVTERGDNADRASVVYFYRKKPKWIATADARNHFARIAR